MFRLFLGCDIPAAIFTVCFPNPASVYDSVGAMERNDNDSGKASLGLIQDYCVYEEPHVLQSLRRETVLWWALALTVGLYLLRIYLQPRKNDGVVATLVGYSSPYEPSFIARLRFLTDARRRIFEGYARVSNISSSKGLSVSAHDAYHSKVWQFKIQGTQE